MKKIAVEEHFTTQGYQKALRANKGYPRIETVDDGKGGKSERLFRTRSSSQPVRGERQMGRLLDLGAGRLAEMDRDGIDMQVLMLAGPTVEEFDQASAAPLARDLNDELAAAVKKHPGRLAGFASLAYGDPNAAAKELERAVKLGLRGAKINSHVGGRYLDGENYYPFWEAAEALGVPVYIHPKEPPEGMAQLLGYPALGGAMWGFMADTSLHALRLICGGVFDRYPKLKIVLGHLGEGIPFWLWRIDNVWSRGRRTTPKRPPGEYFRENFWVSTSGMFGEDAFACVHKVLGADRVLFAVDYPYESNEAGVAFMEKSAIPQADKEKICHGNAEKLFAL